VEGSNCGLFQYTFLEFLGGTEERHKDFRCPSGWPPTGWDSKQKC